MSDQSRYERLRERVESPKSTDCGRAAIYLFERYCRRCGKGMIRPRRHDRRTVRSLWSVSFCSSTCKSVGKQRLIESSVTVKPGLRTRKNEHEVEEMAMLGLQLQREQERRSPTARLVYEAEMHYHSMSEKLRFLEVSTGDSWYSSKYNFWLDRVFNGA